MADESDEVWPEPTGDLPPPEPAPDDWAAPSPVETQIEAAEGIQVQQEEKELAQQRFNRARRFWVTTAVFFGLFVARVLFVEVSESPFGVLWILVPLYAVTLYFVMRRPKKFRTGLGVRVDNLQWQTKVMISVVVFLAIYIPFTFVSGVIIPFASLVEYVLFAFLLFVLLRLSGRTVGIASSPQALAPASHRLHQQVVAPLDDAHYQRTLWLNYNFVEKGKGAKHLARRIDDILESNGVESGKRDAVLAELRDFRDGAGVFTRAGSERHRRGRDRRVHLLESIIHDMNQELERNA